MRPIAAIVSAASAWMLVSAPARAADPDAGARVFKSQCGSCHAAIAGKNLIGPSLAGVVGRRAGSVSGFRYSAANNAADFAWDPERLGAFLADPKTVMPGTSMLYAGLKNETQLADLLAYLATLP